MTTKEYKRKDGSLVRVIPQPAGDGYEIYEKRTDIFGNDYYGLLLPVSKDHLDHLLTSGDFVEQKTFDLHSQLTKGIL